MLVGEDKADVGLVAGNGGHAGVHIHIVVDGDIVPAVRGQRHVPLAEVGVQKAVVELAVIVILLHDDVGGIQPIHPGGHILVILALAVDGVHQHGALHIRAAEKPDALDDPGADPVGGALLVDLKHRLVEHHGGILEPQVAVEVPGEVFRRGILHALVQPDHLRLLGHHVDDDIGRQAVGAVGEPLDEVSVGKARDPHGAALIVDLGVVGQDLKLRHHIRQLTQLPAAQSGGGVAVQHGDLVIADLLHLRDEVTGGQGQQLAVGTGPQHHPGGKGANGDGCDHGDYHEEGYGALLFHKAEIPSRTGALESGGQNGAAAVHGAQQEHKEVKFLCVGVQGGQLHIEVHQPHQRRHGDVDEGAGHGSADGLPGLALPLGAFAPLSEISGVEAAEIEGKGHRVCLPFQKLSKLIQIYHTGKV